MPGKDRKLEVTQRNVPPDESSAKMQLGSGLEPGITGLVKVTFVEVDVEVLASTVLRTKTLSLQRMVESMQCRSR